ncbi:lipoprotein 17-related variable surface protein [Mycoplasma sp. 005V]|uniref:lipoprotein 17-related variable surface protein n=1 Tax=unclassified Mycoplasma TaxID=2683645 RepID=UPI003A8A6B57
MKKKTSKIILSLLPVCSLTALAVSCNDTARTYANSQNVQIEKTDLKSQLDSEVNNYKVALKDQGLLAKLPSEITFNDLTPTIKERKPHFIFQFADKLVPNQTTGTLQVKYYVRALDTENQKWVYSEIKSIEISGFKNDNNLTDEALATVELVVKPFDYKTSLPSQALKKDFVTLTKFNKDLYEATFELVPGDDKGELYIYYKLQNKTTKYITSKKSHVIKGFKTTLQANKEQAQNQLNADLSSIALLAVDKTIDKSETKASQIENEKIVFTGLQNAKGIVISKQHNDQDGTLKVTFKLNSLTYPELFSAEKTITISGFLTNGQVINKMDNAFRKQLHAQIVANPITFKYKNNEDHTHILPSSTMDADYTVVNSQEVLNVKIKSVNKNDVDGTASIVYTVSKTNPKTNNIVETNEEQVAKITGFYTQKQQEIDTEKGRLASEIEKFNLLLLETVNKQTTKASTISKTDFNLDALPADTNISLIFTPNDETGKLNVSFKLITTKSGIGELESSAKSLEIDGFLTNEQEKVNNLATSFSIDTSNISLDASVYDDSTFKKTYLSKNEKEPIQITDKIKSLIVKQISGVAIEIKSFSYDIDLEKDIFKFKFGIQLKSTVNESAVSKVVNVEIDMIPIIANRFLPKYINDNISSIRKTTYGNSLAEKIKPSMITQDPSLLFEISYKFFSTKRASNTITIKSFDDETGSVVIAVTAKIGSYSHSKDFEVTGFLNNQKYTERVKEADKIREELNQFIKTIDWKSNPDISAKLDNKMEHEITVELLNSIVFKKKEAQISIVPQSMNTSKETHSFTVQYKLKSTKKNFEEVISSDIATGSYDKLFDSSIFDSIKATNKQELVKEVKEAQSTYNIALTKTTKIPENKKQLFNSIKEQLFTEIQDKMSIASTIAAKDFFNSLLTEKDHLKNIFKTLDKLLYIQNNLNIISDMYGGIYTTPTASLSFAVKFFGGTVVTAAKMIHGYYLQPLFDNIFNYLKTNHKVFTNPINQYVNKSIDQHTFTTDVNKEQLKTAVNELILNVFNNYSDFYLSRDWHYMVDGKEDKESERYKKTKETWPTLKPGRTWLVSKWADIWSSDRHVESADKLVEKLLQTYKLSGQEAEFIKNLIHKSTEPIFKIGINYANVMYNDLLSIAYKISGNGE